MHQIPTKAYFVVNAITMLMKLPSLGWLHSNKGDVAVKEIISDKKVRQGTRIWI